MKILVTGAAGFIGFYAAKRLLENGNEVVGLDNLNDYYDPGLKRARKSMLRAFGGFTFVKADLADRKGMERLFRRHSFEYVVNLAAQAGVRYSLENPHSYLNSNLAGFLNVLECCRRHGVKHLVYASSSSVYGMNTKTPFSVRDNVDHPVSLYAATKKSNELMAHSYAHLYGIPCTGLRFFTVYGPWGRPDMAYFKFTASILKGSSIDVYNNGDMERDFTYVDDVIEGMCRILWKIPGKDPGWSADRPDPGSSSAPYRVYNIGNNNPVGLMDFISIIEGITGKKATVNLLPMQPGDVKRTCADIGDLARDAGFAPSTPLEKGLTQFINWYRDYYKV